jgi:LmbE family N-acetylglucosaminyl deacetylase
MLLCIYAHPDDESFSCAGTIRRYRDEGITTALVVATRGDRGKCGDPAICEASELPAVRERELYAAAEVLGVGDVHLLDYQDQRLADADLDTMRRALVALVRRHRPLVAITFDPNGYNRHPDHVAISRFAMDAVAAAADPRWYPEAGEPHAVARVLWTPPVAPWDAARAGALDAVAGVDFVLDVSRWREWKAGALRAHRTQHLSVDRHFFNRPDAERALSIEVFRQAWGPPIRRRPSDDLLEGLRP